MRVRLLLVEDNRQLADWLDVQDPTVLKKLRYLDPGVAPDDWRDYTTPPAPSKEPSPSKQPSTAATSAAV